MSSKDKKSKTKDKSSHSLSESEKVTRGRVIRENLKDFQTPDKIEQNEIRSDIFLHTSSRTNNQKNDTWVNERPSGEVFLEKQQVRSKLLPLFFIFSIVGLIFLFTKESPQQPSVHLLAPQSFKANMKVEQVKKTFEQAIYFFQKDTLNDYLQTQKLLIQILESDQSHFGSFGLLCMTYRELWPYISQQEKEIKIVSKIAQKAAILDSSGVNGAICNVVKAFLSSRYQEINSTLNALIEQFPTNATLYELKSDLLIAQSDNNMALMHLSKAQTLWPQWLKLSFLEGCEKMQIKNFSSAVDKFAFVLQKNPHHYMAQLKLGISLVNAKQIDQGINVLKKTLNQNATTNLQKSILAESYFSLSQAYYQIGKKDFALQNIYKAYNLNPFNQQIKTFLTMLGGKQELQSYSGFSEELMNLGENFLKQGNCFGAQAEFKTAFDQNPKNANAAFKASKCLWNLHQSADAITWMNKAIQANSKYTEAYIALTDYYIHRFDFQNASRLLVEGQRQDPKNTDIFKGFAMLELRKQNYQGAITFGQKAMKNAEMDIDIYVLLIEAYRSSRDLSQALYYSQRAIELEPYNISVQINYAKTINVAKGSESAISYLKKQIETNPTSAEHKIALCEILYQNDRLDEAMSLIQVVLEKDLKNKTALIIKGQILMKQNQYNESLKDLLSAATLDPSDGEALFNIGLLYFQSKKYDAAIQQFERVRRVLPYYPKISYYIGKSALFLGNKQRAIDEALKERDMNPNLADAYILAAETYAYGGQYSKCAEEYQKAVRIRPKAADLYVLMGRCFRLSGNLDIALSMLNIAQKQESGYAETYKELGAIYEMQGASDLAVASYQQYLSLFPNASESESIHRKINSLESR